jgi:RecA-family ATPase
MTAEAVRALVDAAPRYVLPLRDAPAIEPAAPGWSVPASISLAELAEARISPRCIVENYLFADVGALIAPGGSSKTTLSIYEAVQIVLGRPLWGLRVHTPGPVLFVTAEDRREFLVARLREICASQRIVGPELARVLDQVRIYDCTANIRRLTAIRQDVVVVDDFASELVQGCIAADFRPVLVQIDPMVSFGVGESRVNDAEQGLINAARVIVAGLDCAVRFVHHTGKQSATDKRQDQYAGRGGSALADGSRMVHVLSAVTSAELQRATGASLEDGESAILLSRPKISHAPPQTRPIYIKRRGFAFELLSGLTDDDREDQAEQERIKRERVLRGALLDAVEQAAAQGLPLTVRTLRERVTGFRTADKAEACAALLASAWLYEATVPAGYTAVNNARKRWLVRLTETERAEFLSTGALPAEKLQPPPSIARRAAE